MGDETGGGQAGVAQIPPRQSGAGNVQFARNAHRRGVQVRVENVSLHMGNRATERDFVLVVGFALAQIVADSHDGAFGWAIGVHQLDLGADQRAPLPPPFRQCPFPANNDQADRFWPEEGFGHHAPSQFVPVGSGQVEEGNGLLPADAQEVSGWAEHIIGT